MYVCMYVCIYVLFLVLCMFMNQFILTDATGSIPGASYALRPDRLSIVRVRLPSGGPAAAHERYCLPPARHLSHRSHGEHTQTQYILPVHTYIRIYESCKIISSLRDFFSQ